MTRSRDRMTESPRDMPAGGAAPMRPPSLAAPLPADQDQLTIVSPLFRSDARLRGHLRPAPTHRELTAATRRAQSRSDAAGRNGSTRSRPAMLTGFISVDDVSPGAKTRFLHGWKRRRAVGFATQKWVYAVLQHGTLRCYRRRADIKHNCEPMHVVELDLQSTLVAERQQSLIVKTRASDLTLRISVHPSSSSSYLQWVTTLYLARLEASIVGEEEERDGEEDAAIQLEKRQKRVTFNDDTFELEPTSSVDSSSSPWPGGDVDRSDLYYSQQDLERFRQSRKAATNKLKKVMSTPRLLVQCVVQMLCRKDLA